jgi:hypothetical protein
MITFRIAKHTITSEAIVEVYADGKLAAAIYPTEPNAIRVISSHVKSSGMEGWSINPLSYRFDFEVKE